jgi:hypothetical protein
MTIAQLRAAVRADFERLERANTAIEALNADSPDDQRTAAQTEFDTAETEHRSATEALTRARGGHRPRPGAARSRRRRRPDRRHA